MQINATVKSYSAVKSKKDLKAQAQRINAGEPNVDVDVTAHFGLSSSGTMGIKDLLDGTMPDGTTMIVTNERRSWFATVKAENGKLRVV
jgi:hypothetical protein